MNKTTNQKHDIEKYPLAVLGDFAWDVLIRTNSKLLPGGDTFGEVMYAPGGSAANAAVWARRCGMPVKFVGKIGRDRFGRLAAENLEWEDVEAHFIQTDEHRTAAVAVWIDENGQRSMVSGRGADFYLLRSELPVPLLNKAEHLHLTAWSLFTDPPRSAALLAAKTVKDSGGTISLDPASFQMIGKIGKDNCLRWMTDIKPDIFFPNLEEGQALTGESDPDKIISALTELFGNALIALKLDANGAMVRDNGNIVHIPSPANSIIDATGAGDSFAGAFLSRFLKNKDAICATRFAVEISTWVVNHISARPTPDDELKRMLKRKFSR
jgi:ribokinase